MKRINIEPELLIGLYLGMEYPAYKIAEIFKCNSTVIDGRINEYKIQKRGGSIYLESELLLALYHGNQYNSKEIAKICRCSSPTILKKLHKYNIQIRKLDGMGIDGKFLRGHKVRVNYEMSQETKQRISESCMGRVSPNLGKSPNQEVRNKISKSLKGRLPWNTGLSSDENPNIPHGRTHPNWRGGVDRIRRGLRHSLYHRELIWRKNVFERDNYTCQFCGDSRGGNLNAHHIKYWAKYPYLRFDVNNGLTLCEDCHIEYHKEYGFK